MKTLHRRSSLMRTVLALPLIGVLLAGASVAPAVAQVPSPSETPSESAAPTPQEAETPTQAEELTEAPSEAPTPEPTQESGKKAETEEPAAPEGDRAEDLDDAAFENRPIPTTAGQNQCQPGEAATAYDYWVNTNTQLGVPKEYRNKVVQFKVSKDLKKLETGIIFDAAEGKGYGDIAINRTGDHMFGLLFVKSRFTDFPRLTMHDAKTGEVLWQKPIRQNSPDNPEGVPFASKDFSSAGDYQANSLSFIDDKRLLLAGPKSQKIWMAKPYETPPSGADYVPGHELDITFPDLKDGVLGLQTKKLTAAGDFAIGPDGHLYGLATTDSLFSGSDSYIVRWTAKDNAGDLDQPFNNDPVILGQAPAPGYGLARIGNQFFMAMAAGTHGLGYSGENEVLLFDLVNSKELPPDTHVRDVPKLNNTAIDMPKEIRTVMWGATSSGEAGSGCDENRLFVEKVFKTERKHPEDQVDLWSTRVNGTRLMPTVTTEGNKTGLQKHADGRVVRHAEYTDLGSEHYIYEKLVKSEDSETKLTDYTPQLACSAVDKNGNDTGETITPRLVEINEETDTAKYAVNVSKIPRAITTCTWVNGEPEPLYGELPFTGASLSVWNVGGALVLFAILASPLALRRRVRS